MVQVTVLYFASLRDAAGVASESLRTGAATLRALYQELRAKHGFVFPPERLRVSMDAAFVAWDAAPREGAEIAFIPPVSGG